MLVKQCFHICNLVYTINLIYLNKIQNNLVKLVEKVLEDKDLDVITVTVYTIILLMRHKIFWETLANLSFFFY